MSGPACAYPHNTGRTGYNKGCRCERCREASEKYQDEYRTKNREAITKRDAKYGANYRAENVDKERERKAKYYVDNRDKVRDYHAKRYRRAFAKDYCYSCGPTKPAYAFSAWCDDCLSKRRGGI